MSHIPCITKVASLKGSQHQKHLPSLTFSSMWQPHVIHWEAENICPRGKKKKDIICASKNKDMYLPSDKLVSWLSCFHEDTWLFTQQFAFWCSLTPTQVKMKVLRVVSTSVVWKLAKIHEENDWVGNLWKGWEERQRLFLILGWFGFFSV